MVKKVFLSFAMAFILMNTNAQTFSIDYNPVEQSAEIQYFTPAGGHQFVGDCIPFFKDGTYYLYWLLDENHHGSLGGLGGHQWCVSTSKDLVHWKHHPIVIGIDEEWEKSICTGSVAFDGEKFYAFYATRLLQGPLSEGENLWDKVNEQLSYAISEDGIHFVKQKPNPFYTSAPGYSKRNFRDPKVVIDKDGTFHLFVASEEEYERAAFSEGRGCLVHLVSKDLKKWDVLEPLLSGVRNVPECPDYFFWNGYYYLVYGQGGDTYYVKSRQPYGPWEYPQSQALMEQWVNVAKTASFSGDRRIVAGWIPSRDGNRDNGGERFGGSIVLREAYQLPNGDLATCFPREVIPATLPAVANHLQVAQNASVGASGEVIVEAPGAMGGAFMQDVPVDCMITFSVAVEGNCDEYGLVLRCGEKARGGYTLSMNPNRRTVTLGSGAQIDAVDGLDKPIDVTVIMKDDIIDVCIDNRRCIVNRQPEQKGDLLYFFARQGNARFSDIRVSPLK